MKKVININFQGRIIPIEETAYEILKQYVDSLRRYFASEEGRDEIINDIESRIAELFSERLKKGSTCITDEDVNEVIRGMGRPEDFEAQEDAGTTASQGQSQRSYTYVPGGPRRLYRNEDDKILGGVCSGLANYVGIDPVIVRILFVVFIGALFWVYIILWIIVPSKSIQSNITKRLYRSTDDKVIGGVCGGLAAYFNINTWIPRLIFALPLIIGIVSGPFDFWFNDWDFFWGPKVLTGSLSFTLFVTYIILWIAVPAAVSAAEKLEMRGERVDLNTIRDTVKGDLESLKARAQSFGGEVKQSAENLAAGAKDFGQTAGAHARSLAAEGSSAARKTGRGIGHVIGILFKAFFLFVAGIIAITLFGLLLSLLFGGFVVFPFKDFILDGVFQNMLAWLSLILFLGIPIVALITWLIRRIMGVRRSHYLGYVFGGLWLIGLISTIILIGTLARNFKSGSDKQEELALVQPPGGKLYIDAQGSNVRYYGGDWFGMDWDEDWPIYGINEDTLMLNSVRLNLVKSPDSLYHLHKVSFSRGRNPEIARQLADLIHFDINQRDSLLIFPKGFPISKEEKFRNQRVLVVLEIPVGKRIEIDRSILNYNWFDVNFNRRGGWNVDWEENWDHSYGWNSNTEYIMTPDGLERVDRFDEKELKNGRFKLKIGDGENRIEVEGEINSDQPAPEYRYEPQDDGRDNKRDSAANQDQSSLRQSGSYSHENFGRLPEMSIALSAFHRLLQ